MDLSRVARLALERRLAAVPHDIACRIGNESEVSRGQWTPVNRDNRSGGVDPVSAAIFASVRVVKYLHRELRRCTVGAGFEGTRGAVLHGRDRQEDPK